MSPNPEPAGAPHVDHDAAQISVIVITLNEEKNIAACLDTLLRLDYPRNRHTITVVDASQDATPEIVGAYPMVRYVRSEKGFSRQRNAGLNATRSEIVAFTDADCLVPPDWLRVIDRAFKYPKISGIGGNALVPPGSGYFERCAAAVGHPAGGSIGFDANVRRGPGGIEFIAGCNSAFRRAALEVVGQYDPGFEDGGEDVDISRRLKRNGFLLDFIPELSVFHKPKSSLWSFMRWNVGVGRTKHNLRRPGFLRLMLEPGFILWPVLGLSAAAAVALRYPGLAGGPFLLGWLLYLSALYCFSRPYRFLFRRRQQAGLGTLSVATVVPALVLVRQVCINQGQLRKWFRARSEAKA